MSPSLKQFRFVGKRAAPECKFAPEHVPKKLTDFFDQNLLQLVELERFLFDQMILIGKRSRGSSKRKRPPGRIGGRF
ncbi:hypothetical protein CU048_03455 [Beijerinckiaceae bacterium]|nr:hypothetical protein CU048_03455 [Beijerinckiaceae bacterium]